MSPPSPPSPTTRAVLALLRWQLRWTAGGLHEMSEPPAHTALAGFAQAFGADWTAAQQAAWARVGAALAQSAQAQAQVPVLGRAPQDTGADADATDTPAATGPVTADIAALLRDHPLGLDESEELDLAVRWWQQARAAGVPVDDDFGDTWRAIEWQALQRHLEQLGREGPAAADGALRAYRLQSISKVALRYGPLKPLLRLLQPLSGEAVASGYTF